MPEHDAWRTASQEWREHWRVGLAAFLVLGLSFGAIAGVSSLFVLPLQRAFNWSRGEIAFAQNASLAAAIASPFLGRVIDRFGVRRLMLGGMSISPLIYLGLAAMNGSLLLFYALYALAAVIGLTASGLTCSRLVSEVFIHSRGLSLAVARSGLGMASAVLPSALFAVIAHFGWRAGYVGLALLVGSIALPAAFFWIDRTKVTPTAAAERSPPIAWRELLRDRRVAILCLGAALCYAPSNAIMSQLQPLLIGKGIAPPAAASLVGIAGLASLAGAFITGALIDRFWAPAVALIFACGSAAGSVLLAFNTHLTDLNAGAVILLIGLGLGAEIDLVAFMVARYFGVRSFASIYGMSVFAVAFAGAVGASLLGASYDRFGDYKLALLVIAACFLSAGVTYLTLGRYPPQLAPDSPERRD